MPATMRTPLPVLLAAGFALLLSGGPLRADERVDYVREVKPLLTARCYACHGALKKKGKLRLDTAGLMRTGGSQGPAIVPGKSGESLLLERVTETGQRRMPPEHEGEALTAKEVAVIKRWIDQGAIAPSDEKPEVDPKDHWAFRPPVRSPVPQVKNSAWVRNPIDAFIAVEHEKLGLRPQPEADRRILLRRVYLDLIGVPPTRAELESALNDKSDQWYEKVVDRLLLDPRYGERWGRHWMDIWRYSDWWGLGAEVRNSQKHIWHWRDWIIESLNQDKGYDQMIREMLAADELYPTDTDKLRATGYLARQYFRFNRTTWMDETIEHTSKAFLGLTMNCAKCHDHKYDPISQSEYYHLRAFFEPYQVRIDQVPGQVDFEKDGLPRVFDCHLDAQTYRFIRGDEKRPVKDDPMAPGLPAFLSSGELQIQPVSLPLEAHFPGARRFVLEDHLRTAEQQIAAARKALEEAKKQVPATKPARAAEDAAAIDAIIEQKQPAPQAKAPASGVNVEQAHAAVVVAEKTLAVAEAQPALLRARAAADRARHQTPPAANALELARQASRLERQVAVLSATEELARAELAVLKGDKTKKADPEKKRNEAREALGKAKKALEELSDVYTPLRGSAKTPESPTETEAARNQPYPTTSSGRRTALAQWLTDPTHPLVARVAVNHMWVRHFGKPIVPTVFDFGRKGRAPTHPALLDYLAVELREHRWNMKHLHRLMVTSATYRMASTSAAAPSPYPSPAALLSGGEGRVRGADAENRFYWRMNPMRMEAQAVRDSLLHLAGELDPAMGGPSIPTADESSRRRSLYFFHSHNDHHKFLAIFDDAKVLECYRRDESILPQQALALSNSLLTVTASDKIAVHLSQQLGNVPDATFVRAAFEVVLACQPTAAEQAACEQALAQLIEVAKQQKQPDATRRARANLVHALINHNDFVTIR